MYYCAKWHSSSGGHGAIMTHSQQLGQLAFVTMLCHALALVVTMIPMPFLFFASFIWKQCNSERTHIPSQGCPSLGGDPSGSTIVTTIYCFFPKPPWCSFATKPEIRQRTPPHPAWCPALQEACGAMESLPSPQIGMGEKLSWQLEWTGNTK